MYYRRHGGQAAPTLRHYRRRSESQLYVGIGYPPDSPDGLVAQRIEHRSSEPAMGVRFPPRSPYESGGSDQKVLGSISVCPVEFAKGEIQPGPGLLQRHKTTQKFWVVFGAPCRIRTCDRLLKRQLLYQLS